jgi:hypothetical protein
MKNVIICFYHKMGVLFILQTHLVLTHICLLQKQYTM